MREPSSENQPEVPSKTASLLFALNLRVRGEDGSPDFRFPGLRSAPAWCVTRDGRAVEFAAPAEIPAALERCLARWREDAAAGGDALRLAFAAARFWLAFIAIHPFVDGNGRTARAYLRRELDALGCAIGDFALIDRYLIEGRPEDLERLAWLFLLSITKCGGNA